MNDDKIKECLLKAKERFNVLVKNSGTNIDYDNTIKQILLTRIEKNDSELTDIEIAEVISSHQHADGKSARHIIFANHSKKFAEIRKKYRI